MDGHVLLNANILGYLQVLSKIDCLIPYEKEFAFLCALCYFTRVNSKHTPEHLKEKKGNQSGRRNQEFNVGKKAWVDFSLNK